jgi:hypothetical protein
LKLQQKQRDAFKASEKFDDTFFIFQVLSVDIVVTESLIVQISQAGDSENIG